MESAITYLARRRSQLDRLYQRIIDDTLIQAVGLKAGDFPSKREQYLHYKHDNGLMDVNRRAIFHAE
jgi:hypothetical protein